MGAGTVARRVWGGGGGGPASARRSPKAESRALAGLPPHLAPALEVALEKHVQVFPDGVVARVPKVGRPEEARRDGVVGDGEPEPPRRPQVLGRHGRPHGVVHAGEGGDGGEVALKDDRRRVDGCVRVVDGGGRGVDPRDVLRRHVRVRVHHRDQQPRRRDPESPRPLERRPRRVVDVGRLARRLAGLYLVQGPGQVVEAVAEFGDEGGGLGGGAALGGLHAQRDEVPSFRPWMRRQSGQRAPQHGRGLVVVRNDKGVRKTVRHGDDGRRPKRRRLFPLLLLGSPTTIRHHRQRPPQPQHKRRHAPHLRHGREHENSHEGRDERQPRRGRHHRPDKRRHHRKQLKRGDDGLEAGEALEITRIHGVERGPGRRCRRLREWGARVRPMAVSHRLRGRAAAEGGWWRARRRARRRRERRAPNGRPPRPGPTPRAGRPPESGPERAAADHLRRAGARADATASAQCPPRRPPGADAATRRAVRCGPGSARSAPPAPAPACAALFSHLPVPARCRTRRGKRASRPGRPGRG